MGKLRKNDELDAEKRLDECFRNLFKKIFGEFPQTTRAVRLYEERRRFREIIRVF